MQPIADCDTWLVRYTVREGMGWAWLASSYKHVETMTQTAINQLTSH